MVESKPNRRASTSSTISPPPSRSGAAWKVQTNPTHRFSASISSPPGSARSARAKILSPSSSSRYDAERRPLLLLPLALRHAYGVRYASFMGGKHSTFNMALWDRTLPRMRRQPISKRLISAISARSEADVLALHQQPLRWRDLPNPLALLPHQPSANDCPLLTMEPGAAPANLVSNSFRRRLKGKERKLQPLPGYRYHVATERRRHHAAARLVLPHQAAADGRTEAAQRVRRSRRRGFRPQRLHDAARQRRPRRSISTRSNATTR